MTVPVLAFPSGTTATASDPPRNGLLAVGGEDGLQIVDPRTGRATRLPGGAQMSDPAWSSDGKLLAVSRWDEESSGVYTMRPDGRDLKLVLQGAAYPSWSPDGNWLAVEGTAPPDESVSALVIVKADGSERRELAVGETSYIGQPQWSPDGKRIAFTDDEGHIRLITPDGETVSLHNDREVGNLSWSPDSSRLAFDAVELTGTMRQIIVVLDLATGRETVLRGSQDGALSPAWSPDGMQLAFLSLSAGASVSTGALGCGDGGHNLDTQLWVMAPDGAKAHRIAKGSYSGAPAWARSLEPAAKPAQEPKAGDVPSAPRPSGPAGPPAKLRPPLASTAALPQQPSD